MKYLIFLLGVLSIISCIQETEGSCPYEFDYPGHYIRIPVTISPHQWQYQVGDTININTVFSDSIYDLGTRQTFKIEHFPFQPLSLLFRFTSGNGHSSGYGPNELNIDEAYAPNYRSSSIYANGYKATTLYENEQYKFESQLVLKEAGTYVLLFTDVYQNNSSSGQADLNEEADAITFEGKCTSYYLCSMIDSGDTHLERVLDKLIYLDEVYNGNLSSTGGVTGSLSELGTGSIAVEFDGFFAFEVVE